MSASETFQQGALIFITPADLVVSGYYNHNTGEQTQVWSQVPTELSPR